MERNSDDDGVDITVTNPDGTTATTTVYDGKGNEIDCEVINEVLIYKDSSNATVINETLVLQEGGHGNARIISNQYWWCLV